MADGRVAVDALIAELRVTFGDMPANAVKRVSRGRNPAAMLRWTDDEWLRQYQIGPARLAEIRAAMPTALAVDDRGWSDHAAMLAGGF